MVTTGVRRGDVEELASLAAFLRARWVRELAEHRRTLGRIDGSEAEAEAEEIVDRAVRERLKKSDLRGLQRVPR